MAQRGGEREHGTIGTFWSAEHVADEESGQRQAAKAKNRAVGHHRHHRQ
jgi:hypothetical protein